MKKPGNRLKILTCCALIVLLATGCWGRRETDELGYVLAMGIDKGKENVVKATFQVAIPSALSGKGGGGGEKGTDTISVEAASLFGALQLANAFVSKDLTFLHNEVVVVSEELAREGLDKYINPLIRSREIRRNVTITVTRGSAADFLKANQPKFDKSPAKQFELLLGAQSYTGFLVDTTLNEFNKRAKSPGSAPVLTLVGVNKGEGRKSPQNQEYAEKVKGELSYLPGEIPREGGNKIEVIGLAAFNGDKLVGFLNGSETRYYEMLNGTYGSANMTFPDPQAKDHIIVVRVTRGRSPEKKIDLSGDKPKISAHLVLEGEIISIQSGINYEGGEKEKELERYLESYITQEATKLIKKTQEEFRSDIIGFGEGSRKFFWTWADWVNYKWLSKYPDAEVNVETSLEIRRTGLMRKTEPVIKGDSE